MPTTHSSFPRSQTALTLNQAIDLPALPPQALQVKAQTSCCSGAKDCSQKTTAAAATPDSLHLSPTANAPNHIAQPSASLGAPRSSISLSLNAPVPITQQVEGPQIRTRRTIRQFMESPVQAQFSLSTLQRMAVGISVASILYNGVEGGVSIGYGKEDQSKSLIFFGIQSFVEVASASLVVWRFAKIALPGEEMIGAPSPVNLKKEKVATVAIGGLLGLLTASAWGVSIQSLVRHERPTDSLPGVIISASALGLMIAIWSPKPWLAKALDSSAMRGEAKCSLACISMTAALLTGTIINRTWSNGWWIDSATTLVLSMFFAKDAIEMIRWGLSKDFSGSCCRTCAPVEQAPV